MTPFDIEIIRTYADCDMNIIAAAKKLYVHPNTIYYHFDKIRNKTGLRPNKFSDLVTLLSMIEKGETDETNDEVGSDPCSE